MSQRTVTPVENLRCALDAVTTKSQTSSFRQHGKMALNLTVLQRCQALDVLPKLQPITLANPTDSTPYTEGMPSVTTGAYAINKDLLYIGVSGDGDSASIGIGQLIHAIRRNMDMVYIVENNGVYGLTKGQYSATADIGSKKKKGAPNKTQPIDLCALAINLGCTFVARSFSGSKKQLGALLKAAMSHKGFALIDVISPCVTFNNNDESMRSYGYVKENEMTLHMADYIPHFNPVEEIEVPDGHFRDITLHDGSVIRLETISAEHDPSNAVAALTALHEAESSQKHVTGLLYFDSSKPSLAEDLGLVDSALLDVPNDVLRPSRESLDKINAALHS